MPDLTATRAVTVCAPAGQVWPWIAQLGQGRGGFYSYDWLERARAAVTRRLCGTAWFDECPPKKQSGLIPLAAGDVRLSRRHGQPSA